MRPMCRSKEEPHESPMAANDTTAAGGAGALFFGAASSSATTPLPSRGGPLSSSRTLVRPPSSGRNSGSNLITHRAPVAGPEAGGAAATPNSRHMVDESSDVGTTMKCSSCKSLRRALRPKRGRKDPLGASRCHEGSSRATLAAEAPAAAVSIAERQDHHSPATGNKLLFFFLRPLEVELVSFPSPSSFVPLLSLFLPWQRMVRVDLRTRAPGWLSHGPGARTVRV